MAEVRAHRESVAPAALAARAPLPPETAVSKSGRSGYETLARVKPGLAAMVEESLHLTALSVVKP